MNDSLSHLDGIEELSLRTRNLRTRLLASGPTGGEPVLFLHGNLATATFWEETMLALPDRYRAVAPDLRGYGGSDPNVTIDATRGFGDWADDVLALADALGWDRFHLVAHSLGGCVAWALLALQPQRIATATLVAPGPPCGFGGARGEQGQLNHPDGAGSGAGLVNDQLARLLAAGEREISNEFFSPRAAMNRLFWKPPFRPAREEQFLTALLQIHQGEKQFPGDWVRSPHWPGFAPGVYGPINALSPRYNQRILPQLLAASEKRPVLWIAGADDLIVSDNSPSDAGFQGKFGLRDGWPGEEEFPPQPLLSQVHYALDNYASHGGTVRKIVLPDVAHTPFLERPGEFQLALMEHVQS